MVMSSESMDAIGESLGGMSHNEQPMECMLVGLLFLTAKFLEYIPGIAGCAASRAVLFVRAHSRAMFL